MKLSKEELQVLRAALRSETLLPTDAYVSVAGKVNRELWMMEKKHDRTSI